jgi:hypothetical protein
VSDELAKASNGLERIAETLVGYGTVVADVARPMAFDLMKYLGDYLDPGERAITFVQALRRDDAKAKVVLMLTDRRLIAVDETNGQLFDEHPREHTRLQEWTTDFWHGTKLTLRSHAGSCTYKQLMPDKEGLRIAEALGLRPDPAWRQALGDMPPDPGGPPVAALWRIHVYEDRLIDHECRHLPFNGEVQATCDTAGNIAVTRGRNLAAKGRAAVLLGPVGLFLAGNAKEKVTDARELYLLVEGPGWAYTVPFHPDAGAGLRHFAQQINAIARQYWQRVQPQAAANTGQSRDAVAQLRELAQLKDAGILTEAEFAEAKARLLSSL